VARDADRARGGRDVRRAPAVGDGRGYLTAERAEDAGGAAEGDDHEERDASFREPAKSRLASSASDTAPSGEVREHAGCLGQPT
jgi:hypothetical protein